MFYRKTIFIFFVALAFLFIACGSENSKTEVIHVKASDIKKEELSVKGMTCIGCETRLEQELVKVEGVLKFKASSKNNTATVEFDKSKTSVEKINKTLEDMGYESTAL